MKSLQFGLIIGLAEPDEMIRMGMLAEKYGFDSIWIPDHTLSMFLHPPCPDAFAILTAIALQTKRVMLATGVTDAFRRHPVTIAQVVATLDRLSNGRAALGIGAGEAMNLTPFGIEFNRPVSRLREAVRYIKQLWLATPDSPASSTGEFLNLSQAFLTLKPVQQPHPPVYLGASRPRTREMVGELAEGWIPMFTSPALWAEARRDIERGARRAQRSIDDIDVVGKPLVSISKDRDLARDAARRAARFSLALEQRFVEQHGCSVPFDRRMYIADALLSESYLAYVKEVGAKIPAEVADEVCAAGSADDCIKGVEAYVDAGARHIVIQNAGPDIEGVIRSFGEDVIPYFRERYTQE